MTAWLATNPDCTENAASEPLKAASFCSNSLCSDWLPAIERTAPGPTPHFATAFVAASTSAGSLAKPR